MEAGRTHPPGTSQPDSDAGRVGGASGGRGEEDRGGNQEGERKFSMKKLPVEIIIAIAKYYHGRNCASQWECKQALQKIKFHIEGSATYSSTDKKIEWDKEASLSHISDVCQKHGFGYEAIAGTFWLRKKCGNNRAVCFRVNESNYLDGGERSTKRYKNGE